MNEVLEDLQRRLEEAEATLRAIRDGEVDALVVRRESADEVFSLAGGDQSYRAFMAAMDLGAAALDSDRSLIFANEALCTLLGRSAAELQATGLLPVLDEQCAHDIGALIDRAADGKESAEVVLGCVDPKRTLVVTVAPLPLDFSRGYAVTFTDISDRVAAAAAEESERIGRAIMASANEAVIVCDADGIITHATAAVRHIREHSPIGQQFEDAFPLSFSLGSGILRPDDLVAVALSGSSVRGVEASLGEGEAKRDMLISAAPLRLTDGGIGGCVITMIDMSERKAVETRQSFLMNELTHRVKNTLALVSAISSRTIATSANLAEFKERFPRRIDALAATHDLLVQSKWAGLGLRALIEAEFAPYLPTRSDRIHYGALDIDIPPRTAIALGMVIHELVTNAVKYGALSNAQGCITLESARTEDGGIEIVWTESGGPPVTPPAKSGFGQTLIARSLGQSRGAGTTVDFRPEGVVCRMRIPASDLG